MNCPKCNKENLVDSIYCRFCSNPLKEKCAECGEMEWIGREIACVKKYREATSKLRNFIDDNFDVPSIDRYTFFGMILTLVTHWTSGLIVFIAYALTKKEALAYSSVACFISGAILFSIVAIVGIILTQKKSSTRWLRRGDLKQEFFRLHPDLAEIIKKAEGEEK